MTFSASLTQTGQDCRGCWDTAMKILVLAIVSINTVVLPILWYSGIHPDFNTVRQFGRLFAMGENVYEGGNPYLPSSLVFWVPFGLLDRDVGWAVWKLLGVLVCVFALKVGFDFVSERAPARYAWLSLLNLGILAGFTAKSGNPGNFAAPLAFASCLLACQGKSVGGILLGIACAIKYPLALPCVLFLLFARQIKPAVVAITVFFSMNIAGIAWLAVNGVDPLEIPKSVMSGVVHVGGYDETGFSAHFAAQARGKYSTLAAVSLWNTAGLSRESAQMLNLVLLGIVAIVSAVLAAKKRQAWITMAVFAPAFLTLTYHRYYDSALIGFSIVLAWICLARHSGLTIFIPATIIAFSGFLIRSVAYSIVYRLDPSPSFLEGTFYNFIVGPIHIYSLLLIAVLAFVLATRYKDS
jgi:hypothetical protein